MSTSETPPKHSATEFPGGEKIDETSQRILVVLESLGGKATTRELSEELDCIDQSQQIHYRVEQYLGDDGLGLIAVDDRITLENGERMKVYKLTEIGYSFVEEFRSEIEDAATRSELMQRLNSVMTRIRDFCERVDDVESRLETVETAKDRHSTYFSRLRSRVTNLENESVGRDIFSDVVEQVQEHEQDIDAVTDWISDAEDTLCNLESRVESIEQEQASLRERIEQLEDDIDENDPNNIGLL